MPLPRDYRTLGGVTPRLSPDALLAIRDARRIQMITSDLVGLAETIMPPTNITFHSEEDSPSEVGLADRESFEFSYADQRKFGSYNHAYNAWRTRLQLAGVLVLAKYMHPLDCRGFSLFDHGVPTIVVNQNEIDQAKIFTLFHEYAHLSLRQSGICRERDADDTERWCNRYAAALLVPEGYLRLSINTPVTTTTEIAKLARRFWVSRHVIALRIKELHLGHDLYAEIKAQDDALSFLKPQPKPQAKEEPEERQGGPTQAQRRLTEVGVGYAGAVIGALDRGILDLRQAGDYLSIEPRSFDPLIQRIQDVVKAYG